MASLGTAASESRVEEDKAARSEVKEDEREEADGLPAKVALDLQQGPSHDGPSSQTFGPGANMKGRGENVPQGSPKLSS